MFTEDDHRIEHIQDRFKFQYKFNKIHSRNPKGTIIGSIDKGPNRHKIELEVSVSVRDEKQAGVRKLPLRSLNRDLHLHNFSSCMTSFQHCYCQRIFTLTQAHHSSSFSSLCP